MFVVGLEENIIPSSLSANSPRGVEEERRLLYVAITRAEKRCFLTSAKTRWRYGKTEYSVPSRFIRDISPEYLSADKSGFSPRRSFFKGDDYEIDRPYTGFRDYGNGVRFSSRMQNSQPVGDRFIADPKPKVTRPHKPEEAVDPLSERTKQRLISEGGNVEKLNRTIANGGRRPANFKPVNALQRMSTSQPMASGLASALKVGCHVQHSRFGNGQVVAMEGEGENLKATVDFENVGPKQLLVKFARLTIVADK